MKRLILAVVSMAFLFGTGCEPPPVVEPITIAEDIAVEAPQQAEKLVDNEFVAATRIVLKPREALPLHKGLDRVVFSLSRYRLRVELQDQAPTVTDFNEGDINWLNADIHSARNGGTLTASYLVVGRKQAPPIPEKESELLSVARGYAYSILSNDEIRVVRVDVAGKGRVPKHFGNGQVVTVVTPAKIRFTAGDETVEKEFKAGDSIWQAAGDRSVRNLSSDPIRYLVFEFKE